MKCRWGEVDFNLAMFSNINMLFNQLDEFKMVLILLIIKRLQLFSNILRVSYPAELFDNEAFIDYFNNVNIN